MPRTTLPKDFYEVTSPGAFGFAGDGVDDVTMTFTGNIAAINTCLAGTTFKPNNGFSGTATLQMTSDDQGHNGAGGARSTTTTTFIVVRPVLLTEEPRLGLLPGDTTPPLNKIRRRRWLI